jgi:ABC-type multidrug transport system fused ATPase/permease subunit
MKEILNNLFIYILIIIFIYIIFNSLFISTIEGFNIKKTVKSAEKGAKKTAKSAKKGTTQAAKQVEKGTTQAAKQVEKGLSTLDPTKAIKELENWIKDIDKGLKKTTKDIEKLPKQIDNQVLSKFTKFFTQLGDILNKGIINPLTALFIGIGNVFMQIFNILILIGNKIASLPGCILYFVFDGIFASIYGVLRLILPKFLMKWIINPIASVFNWFLDLVGYNQASRRCYAFNVDDEVNKMNNQFNNIDKAFKKDFGKLDFSKINL